MAFRLGVSQIKSMAKCLRRLEPVYTALKSLLQKTIIVVEQCCIKKCTILVITDGIKRFIQFLHKTCTVHIFYGNAVNASMIQTIQKNFSFWQELLTARHMHCGECQRKPEVVHAYVPTPDQKHIFKKKVA